MEIVRFSDFENYFKLGIKATGVAYRIQEVEANETVSDQSVKTF